MLERIRNYQFKIVKTPGWESEEKDFVPLRGSWHANSENDFELDKEVESFLSNQKKVLLLLAHSGGGKSFYTKQLALSCWKNCTEGSLVPIPLWISLPALKDPISQAIYETFEAMGFVANEIETLRQTQSFLFILDGYDEIHNLKNLCVGNQLSSWNAKVIVTCRQEYLYSVENYASFFMPFKNERPLRAAYSEIIIRPFNPAQIESYGKQFIQNHEIKKGWESCAKAMEEIHGLKQLITKPFMLKLAMEVLPSLIEHYQAASTLNRAQLTQARLYDVFVEQWFIRQEEKLKLGQHIGQNEDIKTEFWGYAKSLAKAMYESGKSQIFYTGEVSTLFEKEGNPWEKFFNPKEPRLKLLRTACLVQETSLHHYAFIHNSLIEYFLTRDLFDSALVPEKKDIPGEVEKPVKIVPQITESSPTSNLNQHFLVKDVNIIQFLADRVWEEPAYKDFLFNQIYASKNNPRMSTAASNAITILNHARVSFSGMDLSSIHIPKANLEDAILDSVDLREADLRAISLRGAWLNHAHLCGALVENIELGEFCYLKSEDLIDCMSCSSNGNYLAVGTWQGNILLWDIKSKEQLAVLKASEKTVCSLVFSLDEKVLASGGYDHTVRLWNVKSQTCLGEMKDHIGYVSSVAFSVDGKILASGSHDHMIFLWEVKNQKCLAKLNRHANEVTGIVFSPDRKTMASSDKDGRVYLWNYVDRQALCEIGHSSWVTSIAFSPNGEWLAVGLVTSLLTGSLPGVCLWDLGNQKCIAEIKEHTYPVLSLAFSPDGKMLAAGGGLFTKPGELFVWDCVNQELLSKMSGHTDYVNGVVFSPDGKLLISSSKDKTIRFWEPLQKKMLSKVKKHRYYWIYCFAFGPNGEMLASGNSDHVVRLWDCKHQKLLCELRGHTDFINDIVFNADGKILASASMDHTVRLWSIEHQECISIIEGHTNSVRSIAFSPNGKTLVSGSKDKTVKLWDVETKQLVTSFKEHTAEVLSVAFSPNGVLLVSSSRDEVVWWDWKEQNRLGRMEKHGAHIFLSAGFSPDGKVFARGMRNFTNDFDSENLDHAICLWDCMSQHCFSEMKGHTDIVSSVTFSVDGRIAASESLDNTVRLWDVSTGTCLYTLKLANNAIAFHKVKESDYLCVGSHDAIYYFEIKRTPLKLYVILLWSIDRHMGLVSDQLDLGGAVASENEIDVNNEKLFKQRGAVGKFAQKSTEVMLNAHRYSVLYNPKTPPCDLFTGQHLITPQTACVSMVRKKDNQTRGREVFLVIEYVESNHYVIKRADFLLDQQQAYSKNPYSYHQASIEICEKPLVEMKELAKNCIYESWAISENTVSTLLNNLETDRRECIIYVTLDKKNVFRNNSLTPKKHNCLTWCMEHLSKINIPAKESYLGIIVVHPKFGLSDKQELNIAKPVSSPNYLFSFWGKVGIAVGVTTAIGIMGVGLYKYRNK